MNTLNRCVVCKRLLENASEAFTCDNVTCQRAYKSKTSLAERYAQFRDFFSENAPTEENYIKFFELANLESDYQRFLRPGNNTSRRMWFTLNIASVHADWKDELGRKYFGESHGKINA